MPRVAAVEMYFARDYLTGIIFYDDKGKEISETGIVNSQVKRIELADDETIIGFRARIRNDYAFYNF